MIGKVRRLCSTGLIFLDVRDGATTYQLCCNNKRLDGAMMDDIVKNYKPGDVCTAAGYLQVAPRTGAVKSQIVECFSIRVVEQWTAVHKHGFLFDKARQLPRVAADAPEGRRFSILVQCNGLYAQRTFDYLSARYKGTGMETRLFSKLAGQKEHIIGIANSPGDDRAPAAHATAPPPAPTTPSDASPAAPAPPAVPGPATAAGQNCEDTIRFLQQSTILTQELNHPLQRIFCVDCTAPSPAEAVRRLRPAVTRILRDRLRDRAGASDGGGGPSGGGPPSGELFGGQSVSARGGGVWQWRRRLQ